MRASWMAALVAACVVVGATPAQAAPAGGGYVALGDSYSAGSGLFPLANNPAVTPFCAQASRNYPKLVQRELGFPSFTDETCGGAKTVDMTNPQTVLGIFGGAGAGSKFDIVQNGPQFNALRPDTALVTLGIGGNDIGFGEIIGKCIAPWPTGTFCRHGFTRGGVDRVRGRIDELRVSLRGVLEGIRARSPQARIVTIGYPRILPPDPRRCWPQLPVASGDAPWLEGIQRYLNQAIRETTVAFGAEYADIEPGSLGHDACQRLASRRWVEPALPSRSAAIVHPSVAGERAMADEMLRVLRPVP